MINSNVVVEFLDQMQCKTFDKISEIVLIDRYAGVFLIRLEGFYDENSEAKIHELLVLEEDSQINFDVKHYLSTEIGTGRRHTYFFGDYGLSSAHSITRGDNDED